MLDFAFGLWRVQPTDGGDYTAVNPRPAGPDDVGGNLNVASFNVLNYFTTPASQGGRGADDAGGVRAPADQDHRRDSEARRRRRGADRDREQHGGDRRSRRRTQRRSGCRHVRVHRHRHHRHRRDQGRVHLQAGARDARRASTRSWTRRSIRASSTRSTGRRSRRRSGRTTTGGVFTPVVNHLKSKGSDCNAVGDPDTGDGAGNCNLTRTAAAEALVDWLAERSDRQRRRRLPDHRRPQLLRQGGADRRAAGRRLHRSHPRVPGRERLLVRVRRPARLPRPRARRRGPRRRGDGRDGVAHQRRRARHPRLRHGVQAAGAGRAVRAERVTARPTTTRCSSASTRATRSRRRSTSR